MLARISLAVVFSLALFHQRVVEASPLTFDFTGTFSQPQNGSTQFSGSLTINGNPTVTGGANNAFVSESGSDVSLTVNMGGQVYHFVNNPQNYTTAWFQGSTVVPGPGPILGPSFNTSWVEFAAGGGYGSAQNPASFGMTFYDYGAGVAEQAPQILGNLQNFNFVLDTSSVFATFNGVSPGGAEGAITSIELVSAPEPGTLSVFAVLALAAIVSKRRRRP